jgi:hypothetical protein
MPVIGSGAWTYIFTLSWAFGLVGGGCLAVLGDGHTQVWRRALAAIIGIAAFVWAVYRCNQAVTLH